MYSVKIRGWDSSVSIVTRPPTGWTVQGTNPDVEKIFRTRPERRLDQPGKMITGYLSRG